MLTCTLTSNFKSSLYCCGLLIYFFAVSVVWSLYRILFWYSWLCLKEIGYHHPMISYEKLFALWGLVYKIRGSRNGRYSLLFATPGCSLQKPKNCRVSCNRCTLRLCKQKGFTSSSSRGERLLQVIDISFSCQTNWAISQYYIRCGVAARLKPNGSWQSRFSGAKLLKNNVNLAQNNLEIHPAAPPSHCMPCTQVAGFPAGHFCSVFFLMKLECIHKTFHKQKKAKEHMSKCQGVATVTLWRLLALSSYMLLGN